MRRLERFLAEVKAQIFVCMLPNWLRTQAQPLVVDLITRLKIGCNLAVGKSLDGKRKLVIRARRGSSRSTFVVLANEYDPLMRELIAWLVKCHLGGARVEIKSDFYGLQWVEYSSGFMGLKKSRLGLSSHYIGILADELEPIQGTASAA